MAHPFPHTTTLFTAMCEDIPPLVSEPTVRALRETYDRFLRVPPEERDAIEDAIVAFGRMLWPFRKAFEALIRVELDADGHALFARRLTNGLRAKFAAFQAEGGSLATLHDARQTPVHFSAAERGKLCALLMDARATAEERVRAAIATDPTAYERIIAMYRGVQHEVDGHLAALERLADRLQEHGDVAADIRETVREFRRGFAYLAREPEVREVCAAIGTYRERGEQAREHARRQGPAIFERSRR